MKRKWKKKQAARFKEPESQHYAEFLRFHENLARKVAADLSIVTPAGAAAKAGIIALTKRITDSMTSTPKEADEETIQKAMIEAVELAAAAGPLIECLKDLERLGKELSHNG